MARVSVAVLTVILLASSALTVTALSPMDDDAGSGRDASDDGNEPLMIDAGRLEGHVQRDIDPVDWYGIWLRAGDRVDLQVTGWVKTHLHEGDDLPKHAGVMVLVTGPSMFAERFPDDSWTTYAYLDEAPAANVIVIADGVLRILVQYADPGGVDETVAARLPYALDIAIQPGPAPAVSIGQGNSVQVETMAQAQGPSDGYPWKVCVGALAPNDASNAVMSIGHFARFDAAANGSFVENGTAVLYSAGSTISDRARVAHGELVIEHGPVVLEGWTGGTLCLTTVNPPDLVLLRVAIDLPGAISATYVSHPGTGDDETRRTEMHRIGREEMDNAAIVGGQGVHLGSRRAFDVAPSSVMLAWPAGRTLALEDPSGARFDVPNGHLAINPEPGTWAAHRDAELIVDPLADGGLIMHGRFPDLRWAPEVLEAYSATW